ncbi:hypothetical protein HN51_057230 [Arachis hypogaea]|uniref:uncharacterized protein n=1 Tax=Arachis hypogaea TaxID=3818 RepID=UPI0007AF81B0|nr:uncharacterized protein LOC107621743 isoform X2 [Arachis ipaensis]XP_025680473.1 uncharacterized protein LOC112782332 [Arachis hypogaea]QHN80299.1 uncharacterized protein DS421_20g677160 [Arachis hypogaea]
MARKVHNHKRHHEGMNNSQHSMKLQEEASKIMYKPEVKLPHSTKGSKNNGYSNVNSVRELMNEELSTQSCNRNNVPSIVARLMGLDMMPLGSRSVVLLSDQCITDQNMENKIFDDDGMGKKFTNPMLLEEELKKFKREFEAYQALRLKECPKVDERIRSVSQRTKSVQELVPCNTNSKTKRKGKGKVAMNKSRRRFDDTSLSPTQITILKPCCYHEESLINSSETSQGRTSTGLKDFLEEVKVKLLSEMQGKSTLEKCSSVRGSENERHNIKKQSNSKEVVCHRSSEFIDFVTRDVVEANLLHSQSTRSYRSEIEFNGQSSPEFISRGTMKYANLNDDSLLQKELSPMNLVRSFSAPLSGRFSRFSTGDQIRKKLEDLERMSFDAKKKKKKDRFGIREKVSYLKQKFGLRGKIFSKRIHSMVETPNSIEDGFMMRDLRSGPTVLMKHGRNHDNFTEVPPSPASMCSSVHEELWRQSAILSPISTPSVSSVDDSIMPQVYGDINSDLNELSKQLSQLEFDSSEEFATKRKSAEYEIERLLDPAESYIRDLLVASGLYFGSWDKYLQKEDTFTNPIANSIFEEVEESHKKCLVKENIIDNKLDHKMLLDLLNEALSIVLGQPLTMSRFRRKLNNSCIIQTPPCGKELLKLVWDIIHVSLYPPMSNTCSYSFDSLKAQDFGSISLYGLMNDEINNVLEMEMACSISDDLVEELIKDMMGF